MINIQDPKIICPLIEDGIYEISGLNSLPKSTISKESRKIEEIKLEINGYEITYDELWLITFEKPNIIYLRFETRALPSAKKNETNLLRFKTLIIKGKTEFELLNFNEKQITTITNEDNITESFEMIDFSQINCDKHILKKVGNKFMVQKAKTKIKFHDKKQCLDLESPKDYDSLEQYFNSWGIICK